jgi:hypothetical protein
MNITTRVKYKVIELKIESAGTTVEYDIWLNELNEFKQMFERAIEDIDYMIEKHTEVTNDTSRSNN